MSVDRVLAIIVLFLACAGTISGIPGLVGNAIVILAVGLLAVYGLLRVHPIIEFAYWPFVLIFCIFILMLIRMGISILEGSILSLERLFAASIYMFWLFATVLIIPISIDRNDLLVAIAVVATSITGIGIVAVVIGIESIAGLTLVRYSELERFIFVGSSVARPTPQSILDNPNRLAILALIGAVASGELAFRNRGRSRIIGIICCLFLSLSVFLTGSRGGVFGLAAAMVIALFLKGGNYWIGIAWVRVFAIAIPLSIITTIVPWLPDIGIASKPRSILWSSGYDAVSAKPLFGYGLTKLREPVETYVPAGWAYVQPHNSYLGVALMLGVPAAICYGGLILTAIDRPFRNNQLPTKRRPWAVMAMALLPITIVENLTLFSLSITGLIFGISLGYLIVDEI